jgi:hypothetical protein
MVVGHGTGRGAGRLAEGRIEPRSSLRRYAEKLEPRSTGKHWATEHTDNTRMNKPPQDIKELEPRSTRTTRG